MLQIKWIRNSELRVKEFCKKRSVAVLILEFYDKEAENYAVQILEEKREELK